MGNSGGTDEHDPRREWNDDFGVRFTHRNHATVQELDDDYREMFGISRTELNEQFLDRIERDSRVLEVGSNIGTQLEALQEMGFEDLYGVDVQRYAIERAVRERPDLQSLQADALNLPFRDGSFDLVFTSGLLIHIPPSKIGDAIREVTSCSSRYVWGRSSSTRSTLRSNIGAKGTRSGRPISPRCSDSTRT